MTLTFDTQLPNNQEVVATSGETTIELLFEFDSSRRLVFLGAKPIGPDARLGTPFAAAVARLTVGVDDFSDYEVDSTIEPGTRVRISVAASVGGRDAKVVLGGAGGGCLSAYGDGEMSRAPGRKTAIDGRPGGSLERLIFRLKTGSNVEFQVMRWSYANATHADMLITDGVSELPAYELRRKVGTVNVARQVSRKRALTPERYVPGVLLVGGGFVEFRACADANGEWSGDGAAIRGLSVKATSRSAPERGYMTGMAADFRAYEDVKDSAEVDARLDELENKLGVRLLKVGSQLLHGAKDGLEIYDAMSERSFRYKALPNIAGLDNRGIKSRVANHKGTTRVAIDYWRPGVVGIHKGNIKRWLRKVRASKHWHKVDYIVPELGNAHEPIYPYPVRNEASLWC
ncbi:MAG: hypothetical protein AAGJ97_07730, partial [Planctomycetota bacterium]